MMQNETGLIEDRPSVTEQVAQLAEKIRERRRGCENNELGHYGEWILIAPGEVSAFRAELKKAFGQSARVVESRPHPSGWVEVLVSVVFGGGEEFGSKVEFTESRPRRSGEIDVTASVVFEDREGGNDRHSN